ncbi:glutaredoxin family protein [Janibacter sp. G56]|uniref:glutaredoxin family protein n=1 Tax=Janibacter sp. G56 TaxID=3418717 RepID=UPI003D015E4F
MGAGAQSEAGGWTPTARISLVTKPGCHLCEVAREIVDGVARETGASVEEVNVLDDPELLERYAELIPVTFVDGRQHDYWRVDPERLRAALR